VHVRLKDYLTEEHFGLPDVLYYKRAIDFAMTKKPRTPIWVFSDDINLARTRIGSLSDDMNFLDTKNLFPAEVLELMRHGEGYILANSTFGWWAATLAYNKAAFVVAPKTWFMKMPEPHLLIPEHWTRL
jgi:hypothetical protein